MDISAHHFWHIVKELCGQKHMRVLFRDETHALRKTVEAPGSAPGDAEPTGPGFAEGEAAANDLAVEIIANIL